MYKIISLLVISFVASASLAQTSETTMISVAAKTMVEFKQYQAMKRLEAGETPSSEEVKLQVSYLFPSEGLNTSLQKATIIVTMTPKAADQGKLQVLSQDLLRKDNKFQHLYDQPTEVNLGKKIKPIVAKWSVRNALTATFSIPFQIFTTHIVSVNVVTSIQSPGIYAKIRGERNNVSLASFVLDAASLRPKYEDDWVKSTIVFSDDAYRTTNWDHIHNWGSSSILIAHPNLGNFGALIP